MANREVEILVKFGLDRNSARKVQQGAMSLEDAFQNVEKKGKGAFSGIGKGSTLAAGVIGGVVGGAVSSLISKFLQLAAQATQALNQIKEQAVALSQEFEQAEIVFTNIFGDQDAALAFINQLKQSSAELGVSFADASRFAKSILPDTTSFEQFNELLTLAAVGARDAGLPLQELIFSFNEAVAGDFVSIRDRLDIPRDVIKRIKEADDTTQALVEELGTLFEKRGLDIESFADTYQAASQQVEAQTQAILQALGDPVFEQRKESQQELSGILTENAEAYALIAGRVGDLVASIEEFLSSNLNEFLANLDTDSVLRLLDALFELVETGKLIAEVVFGLSGNFDILNVVIDAVTFAVEKVNEALLTGAQVLAFAKAGAVALGTATSNLNLSLLEYIGLADESAKRDPFEAAQESFDQSLKAFDEYNTRLKEAEQRQKDREDQIKSTQSTLNSFEGTLLETRLAEDKAAKAATEYAAALEKVQEATDKLDLDIERGQLDLDLQVDRENTDLDLDFSRDRERIERDNAHALEKIRDKADDRARDASRDLGRDLEKIAREFARKRAQVEIDLSNRKADIERSYQERVRQIQRDFSQSVDDAILNQDVQAFLQAQREKERGLEDAKLQRETDRQSAEIDAQRQREELKLAKQQEVADAKEANQQKLEDLRLSLEQELEEQRQKRDQDLEDQRIKEQQKTDDLKLQQDRRQADFEDANQRRRDDLEQSLKDELEIVKDYEEKKTKVVKSEVEKRIDAYRKQQEAATGVAGGRPNDPTFLVPGRASGGYASSGIYQLGEAGREFVLNNSTTSALERMLGGGLTQAGIAGAVSRSYTNSPTFNISGAQDPQMIAGMVQRQIEDTMLRAERGY